jgi:HAD superfamily hydrolase (TIGR01509 family)
MSSTNSFTEELSLATGNWDAILFDFDGVLADTEHTHHTAWNEVLKPYGIQFTWEEYLKQCVGVADKIVAQRLQLPDAPEAVERKQAAFRAALERTPPFFPETLELVRELARHHRVAVVSSSYRREIEAPIIRAGIRDCFESVICGDDVQRLKPAPDPYLLAAEKMSLRNPLVIEDSDSGVTAGRAAGFDVLRVSAVERMVAELRALLGGNMSRLLR